MLRKLAGPLLRLWCDKKSTFYQHDAATREFKVLMVINEHIKKVVSSSWLRRHWAVDGFLHGSLKMDRSPTSPDHRHNLTGFD